MKPIVALSRSFLILLNATGFALLCTEASTGQDADDRPAPSVEQVKFFESKIRPVLIQECYGCHSSKTGNAKGGLRLDNEQLMHLGGSSGPAVVPGNVDESLIYNAISYQDFEMPPKKRLSDTIVEDFRKWIEMGAPDPRKTEIAQLRSQISAEDIAQAKREFWAYQKPVMPAIPTIDDESWPRRELDRFVLAGLENAQLSPVADAESSQVLRRLCYDLIGLPPSREQLERFVRAWRKDPDHAIATMVDELLESPQYGERWGRHWLDLARYAESNGREVNMTNPHAWRYRDYVIDSFNADKPYDRFVQEQIAGDLLPAKNDAQWAQNLIATSFLALGPKSLSERNGAQFAADLADEQLDTTTRVMLGTSVACARCHDHKFEPIPQADYYALAGIFASTETYYGVPASQFGNMGGVQNRNKSNLLRLPIEDPNPFDKTFTSEELEQLTAQMNQARQEIVESRRASSGVGKNSANAKLQIQNVVRIQARMAAISSQLGGVDAQGKPISYCMGVQDRAEPRDARMLVRGEIDQPAQMVPRDFPQVLRDSPVDIAPGSSGRRELANWIASQDNPLTARVMVNRIWQHLLGAGLVASTEDFGSTGQAPSHPELLDYLALKFVDSGWSIKSMIREICTSRTYRLSSAYDLEKFEQDPENRLLWRGTTRQLDAEAIRDSILFVAGRLDLQRPRASEVAKAGYMQVRDGSLINITQLTAFSTDDNGRRDAIREIIQQRAAENSTTIGDRPNDRRRRSRDNLRGMAAGLLNGNSEYTDMVHATYRSVYLPIVRDELPRALDVFDFAEPSMVVGQRETSSTPNQALFMLNNEFVIINSEALAKRVAEATSSPTQRLEQLFQLTYGRSPTTAERSAVRKFVLDFDAHSAAREPPLSTMIALSQALIAAAEFRVID
ncbi:MAG: PSD1 and planctomycete cytochrome C domain-containing protein [Pirellulaceae bacterium]